MIILYLLAVVGLVVVAATDTSCPSDQINYLMQTISDLEGHIAERDNRISVLEKFKSESEARVDGGWGGWSSWSSCSVSCGGGTQYRTRPCDSPTPSNNGAYCEGEPFQHQNCTSVQCQNGRHRYK